MSDKTTRVAERTAAKRTCERILHAANALTDAIENNGLFEAANALTELLRAATGASFGRWHYCDPRHYTSYEMKQREAGIVHAKFGWDGVEASVVFAIDDAPEKEEDE